MKKIVFILTQDPIKNCNMISSALAQALTALRSGYECEIFLSDDAVKLILPECSSGQNAGAFDFAELLSYFENRGGTIYACNPALNSRNIDVEKGKSRITGFVNASKLIESSVEAYAVFTY